MTGETLIIRPMIPADRTALARQIEALAEFEATLEADRRQLDGGLFVAELEADIARGGGFILVASDDAGRQRGLVAVVYLEDSAGIGEPYRRYAYVSALHVDAAWRRQGVGGRLIEDALRRVKADGLKRIGLGVLAGNKAASLACTSWGFRAYAVDHVLDLE